MQQSLFPEENLITVQLKWVHICCKKVINLAHYIYEEFGSKTL